jgi:hypothetical protein
VFFIYAAELIIKTRIPFGLVFFLSSIILIGIISSSSPAYTQQQQPPQQSNQQFPESIIAASSTDTTPHALKLRATQQGEDGQPKKVSGFKNDLTNVIPAQINSQVLVSITDNTLLVTGAKVRTASDQLIDLIPSTGQTNVFSLRGLSAGVYTLDIITQKGNTKAAYEGILVLGQEPTNPQTRTLVERQTSSSNSDDDEDEAVDGNGNGGDDGEDNGDSSDNDGEEGQESEGQESEGQEGEE